MNDIRAIEALVFNLSKSVDCPMVRARQFDQNGHPSDGRLDDFVEISVCFQFASGNLNVVLS